MSRVGVSMSCGPMVSVAQRGDAEFERVLVRGIQCVGPGRSREVEMITCVCSVRPLGEDCYGVFVLTLTESYA
jgi:hypothetical protein